MPATPGAPLQRFAPMNLTMVVFRTSGKFIREAERKTPARAIYLGGRWLWWWSWGDLNPRPQAFFAQFYMCSRLF